jgi:hypothetical protein
MRKQLSIALALVCAAACKTDPPAGSNAGSSDTNAPASAHTRSTKIDLKPGRPSTPDTPDPAAGSGSDDREAQRRAWRDRRRSEMDTDGDGVISDQERQAAMMQRMSQMRDRLDTDGDGKLTPAELAAARPGRMHFDNPEALDTNHDGDISAEELAAGMKARRDAFRAQRAAQGAAGSQAAAAPDGTAATAPAGAAPQ